MDDNNNNDNKGLLITDDIEKYRHVVLLYKQAC